MRLALWVRKLRIERIVMTTTISGFFECLTTIKAMAIPSSVLRTRCVALIVAARLVLVFSSVTWMRYWLNGLRKPNIIPDRIERLVFLAIEANTIRKRRLVSAPTKLFRSHLILGGSD